MFRVKGIVVKAISSEFQLPVAFVNRIGLTTKDPVVEIHVDCVKGQLLMFRVVECFDHQVCSSSILKWDKEHL